MNYNSSTKDFKEKLEKVTPGYLSEKEVRTLLEIIKKGEVSKEMLSSEITTLVELEYLSNIKDSQKALELIAKNYKDLIMSVVNRYRHLSIDIDDLKNAGYLGLFKSTKKFDVNRGSSFKGYAKKYIQSEIIDEIAKNLNIITIPKDVRSKINKVKKTRTRLKGELGRDATDEEIGLELGMEMEEVAFYIFLSKGILFLNKDFGHKKVYYLKGSDKEDTNVYLNKLPDTNDTPDKYLKHKIVEEGVFKCLEKLKQRDKMILEMHFGLSGNKALNNKEISKKVDLSAARVGKIIKESIKKLKLYYNELLSNNK